MKLVILDRDGVINRDSPDYVKSPDEWQPYPGSLEAISRLHRNHYRVIVATNQSGISRNLLDLSMLHRIHQKMIAMVNEKGGQIDAVFFCPHRPEDLCSCRKPQPGLLLEASSRLGVSLAGVPFVGDKASDLAAARAVNALPILHCLLPYGAPSATATTDYANARDWTVGPLHYGLACINLQPTTRSHWP